MSYINTSAISGYAGVKGAIWWYQRLIKKGVIPLLSQEDVEKAPELPQNHPYNNKVLKAVYVSSVVLYILSMFAFPFIFYLLQRLILKTPDMIFFDNIMASVLSLFPSLLFGFWVCYFLYLKIGDIWPDYRTMALYSGIIGANKYVSGNPYDKTKWEKVIKPEHLITLKEYEKNFFTKATIWTLILTLPVYGLLFFTYRAATDKAIVKSTFGSVTTQPLSDITKVTASLEFKEEKNDGEYELEPRITVTAIFKDGKTFNLCDFGCNSKTGTLVEYISSLKRNYNIPVEVTPLKAYQKELLQADNPNMFLFYQQLVQLGR